MDSRKPVFINLLTIARYDHMPDYPIQFMTVGKLDYTNPEEALLQYEETQQDEETGAILKSDISLTLKNGRITMERKGDFSNTMVFAKGQRFEGVYHTPYGEMDMAVFQGSRLPVRQLRRKHPPEIPAEYPGKLYLNQRTSP